MVCVACALARATRVRDVNGMRASRCWHEGRPWREALGSNDIAMHMYADGGVSMPEIASFVRTLYPMVRSPRFSHKRRGSRVVDGLRRRHATPIASRPTVGAVASSGRSRACGASEARCVARAKEASSSSDCWRLCTEHHVEEVGGASSSKCWRLASFRGLVLRLGRPNSQR